MSHTWHVHLEAIVASRKICSFITDVHTLANKLCASIRAYSKRCAIHAWHFNSGTINVGHIECCGHITHGWRAIELGRRRGILVTAGHPRAAVIVVAGHTLATVVIGVHAGAAVVVVAAHAWAAVVVVAVHSRAAIVVVAGHAWAVVVVVGVHAGAARVVVAGHAWATVVVVGVHAGAARVVITVHARATIVVVASHSRVLKFSQAASQINRFINFFKGSLQVQFCLLLIVAFLCLCL